MDETGELMASWVIVNDVTDILTGAGAGHPKFLITSLIIYSYFPIGHSYSSTLIYANMHIYISIYIHV